jgi:hypothetical protein
MGKSAQKARRTVQRKTSGPVLAEKPIGVVTHYFGNIKVAIVRFKKPVMIGTKVRFEGATTHFLQKISSMQYNHKSVGAAKKGQETGIKVTRRVRKGDNIYGV